MYPDEIKATEAVLRLYPEALREKVLREDYIRGIVAGGSGMDLRVEGGVKLPQEQRYAEMVDKDITLKRAEDVIKAVRSALGAMSEKERTVLEHVFFEGLAAADAAAVSRLSVSHTRALIDSGRAKAARWCIPAYAAACELRRRRDAAKRDLLTAESREREEISQKARALLAAKMATGKKIKK